MSGRIWIFVYAAERAGQPAAVPGSGTVMAAYETISQDLAGVTGLLRNQLLRSIPQPWRFIVASEWESLAAFRHWENSPGHRGTTAPLRPLQDWDGSRTFGPYEVVAEHR